MIDCVVLLVTSNVSNSKLKYWLDYGELLSAGEMKAAYGSFLSALLVIYEHDKLADKFANYYNVTWNRVSPVVFSMCMIIEVYILLVNLIMVWA